jgi:hypothetical protein
MRWRRDETAAWAIRRAGGLADRQHVMQDIRQRGRIERDDAGLLGQVFNLRQYILVAHGAHIAKFLRENEVWFGGAQSFHVDVVDTLTVTGVLLDDAVDVAAGEPFFIEDAADHDRLGAGLGRVIA